MTALQQTTMLKFSVALPRPVLKRVADQIQGRRILGISFPSDEAILEIWGGADSLTMTSEEVLHEKSEFLEYLRHRELEDAASAENIDDEE